MAHVRWLALVATLLAALLGCVELSLGSLSAFRVWQRSSGAAVVRRLGSDIIGRAPASSAELGDARTCGKVEWNVDYRGGELSRITGVFSATLCANECWSAPACKSYTYAEAQGTCYLKDEVQPGRVESSCCVSGLRPCGAPAAPPPPKIHNNSRAEVSDCGKVEMNVDYRGGDLSRITGVFSATMCASECWSAPACKSYTYAEGTCYLKDEVEPGRVESSCCVSGLRPCGAPAAPPLPKIHNNSRAEVSDCGKVEMNVDYRGGDLSKVGGVFSATACASKCWLTPACKSYTYAKAQEVCFLKGEVQPGRAESSGCVSGHRPCAAPPTPPMPPLEPLRGIAYGALPCREHACADNAHVSEDMLQESYAGQWSASGRDDLQTIARLGGNAVRLYHSLGLGIDSDHSRFLNRSAEVGVNVLAGYHTYNPCPDFDCFESWKQATLHGFKNGFRRGDGWHPAIAALVLLNEPDLVHPASGAAGRIKLVLSALDGVLAAETEAGVKPGRTRLTVTWSFAVHDGLDGKFTFATGWGFQDTATGVANPEEVGYSPRCSRAELAHAFKTRWVHGLNTQAPWDFVDSVIGGEVAKFAPIPWFVGEYGANGQLAATIQRDLENIARKAHKDELFFGAAFFQFQTAHFKGGSETNFGLFRLGEQKLSENNDLPVYCLSAHLPWLTGTMGDRAAAVARAWQGSLEGVKGLCNGGRRLAFEGDFALHV